MSRLKILVALSVSAVAVAGCSNKLRVTKRLSPHKLGHYAADGGVVITVNNKICVAPPAQAATTVKLDISNGAKVNATEAVTAEIESAIKRDESLHTLYEQGQATLFLQFMAYRLCEANLNGVINDASYAAELEKINARGETLLQKEIEIAAERTKKAEADANQAKADAEKAKADAETKKMEAFGLTQPPRFEVPRDEE